MDLPPLTYLTVDEVGRGVGASQVLPYVERLAARGVGVVLHSFERRPPSDRLHGEVAAAGVRWHAHSFGAAGTAGGAARSLRLAAVAARAPLVHARSDVPAAAAMLTRRPAWVWDVRSLWVDQRVAMGALRPGSLPARVLRRLEGEAAARAPALTTLSAAAVDVLAGRHGEGVRARATVIPTCVDLSRFPLEPFPGPAPVRLLLSGTFNALYDLDLTLRFVRAVGRRRPVGFVLLRPEPSAWDDAVVAAGGTIESAPFAGVPGRVRQSHAGVAICATTDRAAIAGAVPTKLAEFLASGRPVVVNPGLGDMDDLLSRHRCGVVVERSTVDDAARRLLELLDDPATPERCRSLAEGHFDLDDAVDRLCGVYAAVVGAGRGRGLRPSRECRAPRTET